MFISEKENAILKKFREKKVMTNIEIAGLINCSIASVKNLRRKWQTYTSYNKNGKYYVLPEIPKFDKNGIWDFKGILFSKHGNLKKSIIAIVKNSEKGLTANEIGEILNINPHSFLHHYAKQPEFLREKKRNIFVYYSADPVISKIQKHNREIMRKARISQLPSETVSILILVDMIKHPNSKSKDIHKRLTKTNKNISLEMITNLSNYYGLEKKTANLR